MRETSSSGRARAAVAGALLALGACLLAPRPAAAQRMIRVTESEYNVHKRYIRAVGLVTEGSYGEALAILQEIINQYGADADVAFGPEFGNYLYQAGLCQVNLRNYDEAIRLFENCYVGFPNTELTPLAERNQFRVAAVIQWAGVEQLLGRLDNAIRLYQRALEDAESVLDRTRIDRWTIMVNLGQCLLKTGREADGLKWLTAVLASEPADEAPRGTKEQALMILCKYWVEKDAVQEINGLLDRYDALFEGIPTRRYDRSDTLRYFAHRAYSRGAHLLALRWYDYIARGDEVLRLLEAKLSVAPPSLQRKLRAEAKRVMDKMAAGDSEEVAIVMAIGGIHFELHNYLPAFAGYSYLADRCRQAKRRPEILYNATVSAVKLGRWAESQQYGMAFLDEFPEHPLRDDVLDVMVDVLFVRGDYEKALEIALKLRAAFEVGSKQRDLPDFIVGASLFHLKRFEEAKVELNAYAQNYPNGIRIEPGRYFQAVCYVRLLKWSDAAVLLDHFIADFPASPLMAGAVFHRSLCHFMTDEYDACIAVLERLEKDHPDFEEMARARNLHGDALQIKGDDPGAADQYVKAKALADGTPGQEDLAAYALYQLTSIAAFNRQWDLAAGYYDEFTRKHEESEYRIDATIAAIPALVELDRGLEAVLKLEGFIVEQGGDPNSDALAKAFEAYRQLYRQEFGAAKLVERLAKFPGPDPKPMSLASWLVVGQIEALEETGREEDAPRIEQLYARLQSDFRRQDLANYVIVKLARRLTAGNQADKARSLYQYLLEERGSGGYLDYALLDFALMEAASRDKAERDRALDRFVTVLEGYQTPELAEAATLGIARLLTEDGKHEEAIPRWRSYLDHREWVAARAEANYQLASCMHHLDRIEEALKLYVSTYVNYEGHIDWSSRAYLAAASIQRTRGDNPRAVLILEDMMKRMGHLEHPTIEKARTFYNTWKAELPAAAAGVEGAPAP